MEPLSALQSVDAIISLIKVCRAILQTLQDYRNSDVLLAELARDVAIFAEFLQGLKRVLEHRRSSFNISPLVMNSALAEADRTVNSLQKKVGDLKKSSVTVARRLKFLRGQTEFRKLSARIKHHNMSLHSFLSLVHA